MAEKRSDLQWLRAIAAIEVALWHSDLVSKHFSPDILRNGIYSPVGGIGVELFFIISGFIIASRAPHYKSATSFTKSRILRLYPMYILFTGLVVLAYLLNKDWSRGVSELGPLLLIKSFLILPQSDFPLLGVGWTLEHEMLFYALVAIMLVFVRVWSFTMQVALGVVMATLGAAGVLLGTGPHPLRWDFHIVSPYWIAFALGWMLSVAEQQAASRRFGIYVAIAIGFAVLMPMPSRAMEDDLLYRIASAGTFFVVFCFLSRKLLRNGWVDRLVSRIGDASYSIYLSHVFLFSILGKILATLHLPEEAGMALRLAAVLCALAVGCLIRELVEVPLDRLLRGGGRRSLKVAPVAGEAEPSAGRVGL